MDYIQINKQLRTPIYRQIVNSILDAVTDHRLKHNDHLPTEEEMCATFGISNIVVKQAYKELVDEGVVKRIRGKGTYVHTIDPLRLHLKDFSQFEDFFLNKGAIKKRILIEDAELGPRELTFIKNLDAKYVHLVFVALLEDIPVYAQSVVVNENYSRYFIETDDEKFNTQKWLSEKDDAHVRYEFMVDGLVQNNARLLNMNIGDAAHHIHTTYSIKGEPFAIMCNFVPNEFLHFEFTLGQTS